MKEFRKNPSLPFIIDSWQGNLVENGCFVNTIKPFNPASFRDIARWKFGKNPHLNEKKKERWEPSNIEFKENSLDQSDSAIVWLGHASFYIRLGGSTILIDPVLEDMPFIKRQMRSPISPESLQNVDLVVISHDHRDHLDIPTLRKVLPFNNPKILAPLGTSDYLEKKLKIEVESIGWYQKVEFNGLEIICLPSSHWGRRVLTDTNKRLWGSFLLRYNDKNVYFGSDSGYAGHFKDICQLNFDIDYALMGIGAYSPSFMMQNVHMNPEEAFQACRDLKAKYMIPMHYGTFDLSDEPMGEPIERLRKCFENNADGLRLKELIAGEICYM